MLIKRNEKRDETYNVPSRFPPNFKTSASVHRSLYDTLPSFTDVPEALSAINLLTTEIETIEIQLAEYEKPPGGVRPEWHNPRWANGAAAALSAKKKQIPLIRRWLLDEGIKDYESLNEGLRRTRELCAEQQQQIQELKAIVAQAQHISLNSANQVDRIDKDVKKIEKLITNVRAEAKRQFAFVKRFLYAIAARDKEDKARLAALLNWMPMTIKKNPLFGLSER